MSLDVGGQTNGGGALAGGEHGPTGHLLHVPAREASSERDADTADTADVCAAVYVLEELGLGSSGVSAQQRVDVSTYFVFPPWKNGELMSDEKVKERPPPLLLRVLPGFLGSPPNRDRAKALLMSSWP